MTGRKEVEGWSPKGFLINFKMPLKIKLHPPMNFKDCTRKSELSRILMKFKPINYKKKIKD